MHYFAIVVLAVLVVFLSLFIFVWVQFRKSIYIHSTPDQNLIKKYSISKKEVFLHSKNNHKISGWHISISKPKGMVILVHGYSTHKGGKSQMLGHAEYLKKAGFATFLVDLRSFGESDGGKVSFGLKEWEDLEVVYDYLRGLSEYKSIKIGYLGISMGASTAINVVGKTGKGDFVIASVPFADIDSIFVKDVLKRGYPVWLFQPFVKLATRLEYGKEYKSNFSINLISKVVVPILVIRSKKDDMVGDSDAIDLFKRANEPKFLWEADTGHDVFNDAPNEFKKRVLDFLTSN